MKDSAPGAPCASVIILNYNGRHLLNDCLGSLGAQSFSDFEACVVDNGSADGSVEFIQNAFPWVRVFALDRNLGFCAGNNVAIKATGSEFVALLNNDTRVEPTWLEELVQAMRSHPEAGICASRILFMARPDTLYAAGDGYTVLGLPFMRGYRMPAARRFEEPGEVFSACACAALYRRGMLEEIGLLDEDLFMCAEDVDLGFRARLAGYTCHYAPKAVVYHIGGASQGVRNPRTEFLTSRNYEFVFFKNMPISLLLKYLPWHVLHIAWSLAKSWRDGLALPYLKGKLAFLAGLSKVMRKRAAVQRTRRVSVWQLTATMETDIVAKLISGSKPLSLHGSNVPET